MSYGIGPANTQSSYLPPEQDFPEDNDLFREILAERERLTASILNIKENGQYEKQELLTAQQWFSTNVSGATRTQYTFRLTFDLVAFNGGVPIPTGSTSFTLTATTQPRAINIPTALMPTNGYGGANNGTNFYFINDPLLYVRTNIWSNASQVITITNNTGSTLIQCYWIFEYIKT